MREGFYDRLPDALAGGADRRGTGGAGSSTRWRRSFTASARLNWRCRWRREADVVVCDYNYV